MPHLFNVVPENFFSVLAAPGKIAYWDCILRIFDITSSQLSFGVEREILVDDLEYYFESTMSADIGEENTGSLSPRDKANFMLRKLESCGWITVDVDHSYVQRVNFRDYAIDIIKTLRGITQGKKEEYQGYIYTIYNLCRAKDLAGIGLLEIVKNTDALITSLKSLNANIKNYIDDLTKHSSVAEILDALLNDYYSNVVDKAYHRLLTSDNVSKFRPVIVETLERCGRSRKFLDRAAAEIAQIRELSPEEAREQVLTMLHEVTGAFGQMDDILDEINQKNTKYQRAAINRAKFLLTSSDDTRGQLRNILSSLNEKIQSQSLNFNGIYELEETDELIRIFSWSWLDSDSLYAPIEGKKEFRPSDMEVPEVDEASRTRKRNMMRQKMDSILTPEKIGRYVLSCLGGRTEMTADETVRDEKTFIKVIYVRLYGQRKRMPYRIELLENTVEVHHFRFKNFKIIRRT